MMTDQQKADRLALIKTVSEKRNAKAAFKKKVQAKTVKVRRYTDEVEAPKRKTSQAEFDSMVNKLDENHNQWTDAPSYAKEYYGEVYAETTRFDNDWN